ncbi:MAG: clostripain-related cysteine peptidase [Bacteroidales bacterium]
MIKLRYIIVFILLAFSASNIKAQYCDAKATEKSTDYIKKVVLEGINNRSESDGYADYSDVQTANLSIGGTYRIRVTNANHHSTDKMALWVDWNQDKDFEDKGEKFNINYPLRQLEKEGMASIRVPKDAKLGKTRLRIVLCDLKNPEPCGDFYYGEVEDYGINVCASNIAPIADFAADHRKPYVNTPVNFKDLSTSIPSTFEWSFSPNTITYLNGTSSKSSDPVVEFDKGGVYSVTLKAKNSFGENEVTKKDFIEVVKYNPPFNLSATTEGKTVDLSWGAPIYESFEFYQDFSLDLSPWTQFDGDSRPTLQFTSLKFPNMGYTGSFIVMNPNKTTPALPNSDAVSGNKFIACFRNDGDINNDWLISPKFKVENNEILSFYAKTISQASSLDKFKVWVSTTDTDVESFKCISGEFDIAAPLNWTKFSYGLSAYQGKDIHIAIQCVSSYALALCLDDISITQGNGEVRWMSNFDSRYLTGFKIFRDDELVGMVNNSYETFYRDNNVPEGKHTYSVTAVYVSPDCESAYSNKFEIEVNNSKPELEVVFADRVLNSGSSISTEGFTPEGESKTYSLFVKNTGNKEKLTISDFKIEGVDFELVQGPKTTIDPESTSEVKIKYTPKDQGADLLKISFKTNDANEADYNCEIKTTTGAIWTWMLYLYEDGTGLNGFKDINEWEVNGSIPDKIQYLILYDSDNDEKDGVYLVKKDLDGNNVEMVSECIYKGFGVDFNMNSYETLERFMKWSHDNYPANKYGLTVWDHGTGIFDSYNPNTRGAVGNMKLFEMRKALSSFKDYTQGQGLEVMSFDLCLLGSVETVYELKDCANYVIASQKTEPSDGWDYANAFKGLNANPNLDTEELARQIVQAFYDSYVNGTQLEDVNGTTQSFTKTENLANELIPALNNFSKELIKNLFTYKDQITSARDKSWYSDNLDEYIDLSHFASKIKEESDLPQSLKDAANAVNEAVSKSVLFHKYTKSANTASTGLKIWFPKFVSVSKNYKYYIEDNGKYLKFGETCWDDFLEAYEKPVAAGKPFVKYSIDKIETEMLNEVRLRDESSSNPMVTRRKWTIEPEGNIQFVDGYSENSKSPVFYFTAPGVYDISLELENEQGSKVLKRTKVINVKIPTVAKPELQAELKEGKANLTWKGSKELTRTFSEGFEDPDNLLWEVKTSSDLDYSKAVYPNSGAVNWQVVDEKAFNGAGKEYIHSGKYACGIGYNALNFSWIITPKFTASSNEDLGFYTWYKNNEKAGDGKVYYTKFYVLVIYKNKAYKVLDWSSMDTPSNLLKSQVIVDLADYEDKEIQLAFVHQYNNGFQLIIDDVVVGKGLVKDQRSNASFQSKGFRIYKNKELLKEINDPSVRKYSDVMKDESATYTVTELFTNPSFEGEHSNTVKVGKVGISENNISNCNIYPNPTSGNIIIDLDKQDNYKVSLIDGLGSVKLYQNIENTKSFSLDLSKYSSGVYFLRISNGQKVWVEKVNVIR